MSCYDESGNLPPSINWGGCKYKRWGKDGSQAAKCFSSTGAATMETCVCLVTACVGMLVVADRWQRIGREKSHKGEMKLMLN